MGIVIGLLVLSLIVFLHELGHFLAAKALGVPAPLFSVGLGPALWKKTWRGTEYQIALLPLGGFVLFGRGENLDMTRSLERIIIYAAGPLANFLTALVIYQGDIFRLGHEINALIDLVGKLFTGAVGVDQLAGPLGIMNAADVAFENGLGIFLGFIAFLSINLGVLNLLPLPILDGGQILIAMIEGITRTRLHIKVRIAVALVCWAMLFLLIAHVTINDVTRLVSPAT